MDFIGNPKTIFWLNKILEKDAVSHAYLFSGPDSLGKFLAAKAFAAGVIQGERSLNFDLAVSDMLVSDLSIIEPEVEEKKGIKKIKDISIEAIRDVGRILALYPTAGKRRVLIIDDAQRMSPGAQNALLKTLEEPSDTAVIILVTSEEGRLLPTVRSRCQRVGFQLVGDDEIASILEKSELNENDFKRAPVLAAGRPGKAVGIAGNPEEFKEQQEGLKSLASIGSMGINGRLILAEKMSKDAAKAIELLELWQWSLHKARSDNVDRFAAMDHISQAIKIAKTTNANLRLVLENLFLGHSV